MSDPSGSMTSTLSSQMSNHGHVHHHQGMVMQHPDQSSSPEQSTSNLQHQHQTLSIQQQTSDMDGSANGTGAGESSSAPAVPVKRGPGRPKGSGKNQLAAIVKEKRPVGRPRKDGLPPGSVGPRVPSGRPPGRPRKHPLPATSASASAPSANPFVNTTATFYADQPTTSTYSSLANAIQPLEDEWLTMMHGNSGQLLTSMLATFQTTHTTLSPHGQHDAADPTLPAAFASHLTRLATDVNPNRGIPNLYAVAKTFWIDSHPPFFQLTAATSGQKTSEHRFFYWDPLSLVFNGISCPHCGGLFVHNGRIASGPVKVFDVDKPFYIIGCEYVCTSATCVADVAANPPPSTSKAAGKAKAGTVPNKNANTNGVEGRRFASTDWSVLRALPASLKDEFPAYLVRNNDPGSNGDLGSAAITWNWTPLGVSPALWAMVTNSLKVGLKHPAVLEVVKRVWGREPMHIILENGEALVQQQQLQLQQLQAQQQQAQAEQPSEQNQQQQTATASHHASQQSQQHVIDMRLSQQQHEMNADDQVQEQQQQQSSNPQASVPQDHVQQQTYYNTWGSSAPTQEAELVYPSEDHQTKTPVPSGPQQQSYAYQSATNPNGTIAPANAYTQQYQNYATFYTQEAQDASNATGSAVMLPNSIQSALAHPAVTILPAAHHMPGPSGQQPHSQPQPQPATHIQTLHVPVPSPIHGANGIINNKRTFHAGLGPGANADLSLSAPPQKRVRHCCKCGSQNCKGKGGRAFCTAPCQDCGTMECKGRNSKRPDKPCTDAWT